MEIFELAGDIFTSECEAIVNPVNCVGVMGKGLALKYAKLFPKILPSYKKACITGDLKIGKCHIWEVPDICKGSIQYDFTKLEYVVNFPTKNHWLRPSKQEWIQWGLVSLASDLELTISNKEKNSYPRSIAFPALGCDLGGLDWNETRSLMLDCFNKYYSSFNKIKLYSPYK